MLVGAKATALMKSDVAAYATDIRERQHATSKVDLLALTIDDHPTWTAMLAGPEDCHPNADEEKGRTAAKHRSHWAVPSELRDRIPREQTPHQHEADARERVDV